MHLPFRVTTMINIWEIRYFVQVGLKNLHQPLHPETKMSTWWVPHATWSMTLPWIGGWWEMRFFCFRIHYSCTAWRIQHMYCIWQKYSALASKTSAFVWSIFSLITYIRPFSEGVAYLCGCVLFPIVLYLHFHQSFWTFSIILVLFCTKLSCLTEENAIIITHKK